MRTRKFLTSLLHFAIWGNFILVPLSAQPKVQLQDAGLIGNVYFARIYSQVTQHLENGENIWLPWKLEKELFYNPQGKLIAAHCYDWDGVYVGKFTYRYNFDNSLGSATALNAENQIIRQVEYLYDKSGEVASQTTYEFDTTCDYVLQVVYERNEYDQLVIQKSFVNGVYRTNWRQYIKNYSLKIDDSFPAGKIAVSNYSPTLRGTVCTAYDKRKNWIYRVTKGTNWRDHTTNETESIRRDIQYY